MAAHPIVPAFKKWSRQTLPKGAQPTSKDAALFFAIMQRTDAACVARLSWHEGLAMLDHMTDAGRGVPAE